VKRFFYHTAKHAIQSQGFIPDIQTCDSKTI